MRMLVVRHGLDKRHAHRRLVAKTDELIVHWAGTSGTPCYSQYKHSLHAALTSTRKLDITHVIRKSN